MASIRVRFTAPTNAGTTTAFDVFLSFAGAATSGSVTGVSGTAGALTITGKTVKNYNNTSQMFDGAQITSADDVSFVANGVSYNFYGDAGGYFLVTSNDGVFTNKPSSVPVVSSSNVPEIAILGNGVEIVDGDATPSATDHTVFGSQDVASGSITRTFTIKNTGQGALSVGAITIDGANPGDFTVTSLPASSVATGGSTTFSVAFDPSATGTRNATISVANNDDDENPYNFSVSGFGGGNTPPTRNNNLGLTLNEGATGTITMARLDYNDAEQADNFITYTVTSAATNGTLFRSGVALGVGGTFTQTDINNSLITYVHDSSETTSASFGFSVTDGTATVANQTFAFTVNPVTDVTTRVQFTANDVAFDVVLAFANGSGSGTVSDVSGTVGGQTITGLTPVAYNSTKQTFDGAPFTGTTDDVAFVANGVYYNFYGSGNGFLVTSNNGEFSNTVSSSPVVSSAGAAEIAIRGNSVEIVDGDTTPSLTDHTAFGAQDIASGTITRTFTIENSGSDTLSIGAITIGGANPGDFTVTTLPAASVAIGGNTTFSVTFDPSAAGTRNATISVANNDATESPYNFSISGIGGSNTPPTSNKNGGLTLNEGATGTITAAQLDFNDAEQADGAITYTVTSAATNGTLFRSGVALAVGSTFTQADIGSNLITYKHNSSETTSASFGFSVNDGAAIVTNQTFNITVDPVADVVSKLQFTAGSTTFKLTLTYADGSGSGTVTGISGTATGAVTGSVTGPVGYLTATHTFDGAPYTAADDFSFAVNGVNYNVYGLSGGLAITSSNGTFSNTQTTNPTASTTTVAEIAILGNAVEIVDGDTTPNAADHTVFGTQDVASGTITRTFTIDNTGGDTLSIGAITIGGAHPGDFTVTTPPASSVAPGGSTTFLVTFDPSAAGTRNATISIVNSDDGENPYNFSISGTGIASTISIGDVTHNEGNNGTTTSYDFTVALNTASTQTVTVAYTTADGTATTADGDYATTSGTLTLNPGETSKTVTVAVNGDTKFEANETFTVNLSSPNNATIADGQGVGTITNDDTTPTIAITDVTAAEGSADTTTFTFTVSLSAASGLTTTVNYATADGTALAGSDYTAASGTLTFAPGVTTQTVTVNVSGDTVFEANQTFFLNLSGATNATITDAQGVGTITNDDAAPTLTISDVTVSEGAGVATFTVTRTGATELAASASFATVDGSAHAAADGPGTPDYTATSGAVSFNPSPAATETQTISVSIANDTVYEASEQFTVNLSGATNATIADAQGVGTITDNDIAPSLAIGDVTVNEGAGTASFTVTLTGATALPIAVNYATIDGTAVSTAGGPGTPDYTATSGTLTFPASTSGSQTLTLMVPIINDAVFEAMEQFAVNLSGPTNGATLSDAQGIATINDEDTPPTISVTDVTAAEGNAGTTSFTFTVSLSAASGLTTTVNYATANGTALAGSDYAATSGTLTFAPGVTTQTVTVIVTGDTVFETDQTYFLNLSAPTNATIADGQGLGTITNDDASPTLTVGDVTVSEGGGIANFTVTLRGTSDQPVTVTYATADGTAVSAATATPGTPDYTAKSGTLTFNPSASGTQTLTVMVPITNDSVFENTEQFVVNLSNATGGAVISDNQGVGTITNDDPPPAPSQPDLVAASDSGVSNSDNLTNVTRPTFTGTAAPGVTVTLYEGVAVRGSGIAAADGTWTITVASALADGSHAISAQASSGGLVGPASTALTIVVDTVAPAAPSVALARDTGISGTDGLTNDASLAIGATDSGGFGYRVDTGVYSSSYDPTALADGPHTVSVFQFDAAGNASADRSVSFVLDRTAPTARPDTASGTGVVTKLSGNLLANDSDASAIRATDVQFAQSLVKTVPGTGTTEAYAAHGSLTVAADGSYSYQPRSSGRDSFSYTVTDAAGNTSRSTLTVDVAKAAIPASLSLAFALTDAKFDFSTGHDLVTAPNGTVIDLTGVGTISFTDGTVQEADGAPLVDDLFYYAKNLDVWRAQVDPDTHYASFGWREGRDPNELFSTKGYLAANPDVAGAGINPLTHYETFGVKEGRSPGADFSAEAYRAANPDVARAGIDPLTHYLGFGQAEDRFAFPGATVAKGSGDHLYGDFDATFYLRTNTDVAKAAAASGINADSFAFTHYLTFGAAEGRDPDAFFSTKGYLAANPDVAASGQNPLLQYASQGWFEGRDPGATFHTNAYLVANPDVAAAHVDPLQHYLQFGMAEGRMLG